MYCKIFIPYFIFISSIQFYLLFYVYEIFFIFQKYKSLQESTCHKHIHDLLVAIWCGIIARKNDGKHIANPDEKRKVEKKGIIYSEKKLIDEEKIRVDIHWILIPRQKHAVNPCYSHRVTLLHSSIIMTVIAAVIFLLSYYQNYLAIITSIHIYSNIHI